jgi:hypothetical protein
MGRTLLAKLSKSMRRTPHGCPVNICRRSLQSLL